MTFLFVDRITSIEADRATGELCAPADRTLPIWLVIEGIGQLAGWVTAARTGFSQRPVAALVGEAIISGAPARGTITLEARVDRIDARAILYSGRARVGDIDVATLARCVGPLLPMELFDDPAAVRARFETLRTAAAPRQSPSMAGPTAPQPTDVSAHSSGGRATLRVPDEAPFFADHFPRRPVYPASLLASALGELAGSVAAAALGVGTCEVEPVRVSDYKVRAFSPPGQVLALSAEARSQAGNDAVVAVFAHAEGKRVAGAVIEYRRAPAR